MLLHEVMHASTIDEDYDRMISNPANHTQGLGCCLAKEGVKTDLGRKWVGLCLGIV